MIKPDPTIVHCDKKIKTSLTRAHLPNEDDDDDDDDGDDDDDDDDNDDDDDDDDDDGDDDDDDDDGQLPLRPQHKHTLFFSNGGCHLDTNGWVRPLH